MSGLTSRARLPSRTYGGGLRDDLGWILLGVPAVLLLAFLLSVSVQATAACALVLLVVGLHQWDRRAGIFAMFALWFLAPGLRRILGVFTGYVENDPLSVAPFVATAAIAALELVQVHMPSRIRLVMLTAAIGFAIGIPVGMITGPRAAVYAAIAYFAGLSAVILGFNERGRLLANSALRATLLYGLPAIAVYAIAQRAFALPPWDQYWLESSDYNSIGAARRDEVRVFGTLNGPGALAPLLCMSLLCYLSVRPKHLWLAVAGATALAIAISLTQVRSAWVALMVAALAHVIASRGASARLVFSAAAVIAAVTLALSPVSATARDVRDRFTTLGSLDLDRSADERSATVSETLPKAISAPLGHGLGSAGDPSKLSRESELRTPDNGYLALIYQVGPIGFLMVMMAIAFMLQAAWKGARDSAPGQDLRLLLFTLFVFLLVQLYAGDELYGSHGVIFWFIGGQVLAYEFLRRRRAASRAAAGQ